MADVAPHDVFISYARRASAEHARALTRILQAADTPVFLDEREIPFGERFPERLVEGLLGARVVVVFVEPAYFARWYCRLEYEVALAPYRRLLTRRAAEPERITALEHLVVALAPTGAGDSELDALPPSVRTSNWASADDVTGLRDIVLSRLSRPGPRLAARLDAAIGVGAARELFTRVAPLPQPLRLSSLDAGARLPLLVPPALRGTLRERFLGRAEELWRLHDALAPASAASGSAAVTSTVRGVGGVGKTQLAAEYFYRYGPRHYMGGLFWLDAKRDVVEQHHAILRKLGVDVPDLLTLRQRMPNEEQVAREVRDLLGEAFRAIPADRPALLVLDDVPEPGPGEPPLPLETWLPASDAVACLVTSRASVRFEGGGTLVSIALDVLSPDAAVAVLTSGQVEAEALSDREWRQICAWVGFLPIALVLLNSAMGSDLEPLSPRQVLAAALQRRNAASELDMVMSALRPVVPQGALRGITEAFSLSYDRLPAEAQVAARLLAQFGPEPMPVALLDTLGGPCAHPAARALLKARSLVMQGAPVVTHGAVAMFGTMHPVLADYLRARGAADGTEAAEQRAALRVLSSLIRLDACHDARQWPLLAALQPHALALVDRVSSRDPDLILEVVALRASLGYFFISKGTPALAVPIVRAALDLATDVFGPAHCETLKTANRLAATLIQTGDLDAARALLESTLEAQRRILGPEHPDTLRTAENLSSTLGEQHAYEAARALQEQLLEARLRLLGAEHPDTLRNADNLALTLFMLGDYAAARVLQERALEAQRRLFGPEDPATLKTSSHFGATLDMLGDQGGARAVHESTLAAQRRVLGHDHPDTLWTACHLALTLFRQGDREAARTLLEQTLAAQQRVLGADHPDAVRTAENLAVTRSTSPR